MKLGEQGGTGMSAVQQPEKPPNPAWIRKMAGFGREVPGKDVKGFLRRV